MPALAQMGKLTGERKYYDDAVRQVLQFSGRIESGDFFSQASCHDGNCFVSLAVEHSRHTGRGAAAQLRKPAATDIRLNGRNNRTRSDADIHQQSFMAPLFNPVCRSVQLGLQCLELSKANYDK